MTETDPSLEALITALEACPPSERIDLREPILDHGVSCITPLLDLALADGGFAASVASWLEVLATRDPDAKPAVVKALVKLGEGIDGHIARQALARLNPGAKPKSGRRPDAHGRSLAEEQVHQRIIQAARDGRTVFYSDLETSRGHIGKYLLHISQIESDQGHPPLTSIVVSKSTGRPGDGFLPAMQEVGFAQSGETLDVVWRRAVAAVHGFWRDA